MSPFQVVYLGTFALICNTGVNPGDAQHDGETGVVTILDVVDMCSSDTETETLDIVNTKMEGVVAHFVAHNKVEKREVVPGLKIRLPLFGFSLSHNALHLF